jgi:1,4-alpha-glucan branching enzyme
MWEPIHAAERQMESLVASHPDATGQQKALLNQAARELLLLQSSDWPFLVTTGQAKEYASQRFSDHVERFNKLAELVESGESLSDADREFLDALSERDNPFDRIDYRNFAARQGHAELIPE